MRERYVMNGLQRFASAAEEINPLCPLNRGLSSRQEPSTAEKAKHLDVLFSPKSGGIQRLQMLLLMHISRIHWKEGCKRCQPLQTPGAN
jgi:hypothetical protein